MDRLALVALSATKDDYESVQSVGSEIGKFLGRAVTEQELLSVFRSLEDAGFVEAYREADGGLVPTRSSEKDLPEHLWFLATAKGREVVDRDWQQVFGARSE